MKTGMILSGMVLILGGLSFTSVASAEERCKVFAESSQAKTESDADKQAWTYGRDACWSFEREIGKTTTYTPGLSECVSKTYENNVEMWTCTYAHVECCYTP